MIKVTKIPVKSTRILHTLLLACLTLMLVQCSSDSGGNRRSGESGSLVFKEHDICFRWAEKSTVCRIQSNCRDSESYKLKDCPVSDTVGSKHLQMI